jgi:metal-sulfur cluster biosynthetic enzyme
VSDQPVQEAWQALEGVADPELGVSVVSMGLIRGLTVEKGVAAVKLTFTSMGCPWTDWIEKGVREKLLEVEGVHQVDLEVVWDRPWSRKDLRQDAREALKRMGIAP